MKDYRLPGCVKPIVDFAKYPERAGELEAYDFWSPSSTGTPFFDFAQGVLLAERALADAILLGSPDIVLAILKAMRDKAAVADAERGFLWRLAARSIAGKPPKAELMLERVPGEWMPNWKAGCEVAIYDLATGAAEDEPADIVCQIQEGILRREKTTAFAGYRFTIAVSAIEACRR